MENYIINPNPLIRLGANAQVNPAETIKIARDEQKKLLSNFKTETHPPKTSLFVEEDKKNILLLSYDDLLFILISTKIAGNEKEEKNLLDFIYDWLGVKNNVGFNEQIGPQHDILKNYSPEEILNLVENFASSPDCEKIPKMKEAILKNVSDTASIMKILQNKYGFIKSDFKNMFLHYDNIIGKSREQFLFEIKNDRTFDFYKELKKDHTNSNAKNYNILFASMLTKDKSDGLKIFKILKERLNIDIFSDYKYMSAILNENSICKNLLDVDFLSFFEEILRLYYTNTNKAYLLPQISGLYDDLANDQKSKKLLTSDKYVKMYSYFKDKLQFKKFKPSTLITLLEIADDFDKNKLESILEKLKSKNEKIY